MSQDVGGEGGVKVVEEARDVEEESPSNPAGVDSGVRFVAEEGASVGSGVVRAGTKL